ncbi:MAG: hypothetical protein ACTSWN_08015, partial [Promethearchaeota archaeon]
HSHPGDAFSSGTDTQTLLNFGPGMFSLIVPNFASAENLLDGAKLYACKLEKGKVKVINLDPDGIIEVITAPHVYRLSSHYFEEDERRQFDELKNAALTLGLKADFALQMARCVSSGIDRLIKELMGLNNFNNKLDQGSIKEYKHNDDQVFNHSISKFEHDVREIQERLRNIKSRETDGEIEREFRE